MPAVGALGPLGCWVRDLAVVGGIGGDPTPLWGKRWKTTSINNAWSCPEASFGPAKSVPIPLLSPDSPMATKIGPSLSAGFSLPSLNPCMAELTGHMPACVTS